MALPLAAHLDHDFSAQLQRVDNLHQQLKTEAARAQDFLAKLKRGEEIQSQAQAQTQTQAKLPPAISEDRLSPLSNSNNENIERQPKKGKHNGNHAKKTEPEAICCCQHHQSKPLTEQEKKLADEYRKARLGPLGSLPPLPTHVDEREVRDLEKRVRGLEGRVRGFEGLPPDRELALMEVERLRRELEGLARRREGLFGLIDEKAKGVEKANGKENAKGNGKGNRKS
ncbi:hypothetical protein MMC21_001885 [Puttea exsequens]|nr:hypothetical protein [Puttea exsequens]